MAYPSELAERLTGLLGLDGTGRLLDVGCGPGSLTLLLADRFDSAIGVDADAAMLAEAERLAQESGVRNVGWRQLYAEDLPADLGTFRMITFAQSFHWMDRARVAKIASGMLTDGGACVHVHATTHRGIPAERDLPYPEPPHADSPTSPTASSPATAGRSTGSRPTSRRSRRRGRTPARG